VFSVREEKTVRNIESRVVRIFSYFVFVALGAAAPPSANRDLPFIENDYARSLSDARARKLPLAVEVHSLVCPACRTMAVTVLREPGITRHSPSFVWAKLDAGMLENAEFLNRFPVTGTPMFLIIEPETEKVLAKHVGLADEGELSELLEQSLKEFRGKRMDALHAALTRADHAFAVGQFVEATKLYRELLKDTPRDWAGGSPVAEMWLAALVWVPDYPECTRVAQAELPRLRRNSAWVRSVGIAEFCVSKLPDAPERAQLAAQVDALGRAALEVPVTPLTRAALYGSLLATRTTLKDEEGEKRLANSMFQFLESARAKVPTAQERSALDSFLVRSATTLGRLPQVLPYLQASERELPESPAASAVLANAYASLNRFDEALAAIDRAISKAPPVLRVSLVSAKAGMFQKKGDSAAARRTWDEAVHLAEELPSSPRFAKMVAWTKTQREKAMAAAPPKVAQP